MYTPEVLVKIRQAWMDLRRNWQTLIVWSQSGCSPWRSDFLGDIGLASEIALTTFEEANVFIEIALEVACFTFAA